MPEKIIEKVREFLLQTLQPSNIGKEGEFESIHNHRPIVGYQFIIDAPGIKNRSIILRRDFLKDAKPEEVISRLEELNPLALLENSHRGFFGVVITNSGIEDLIR